MKKLVVLFFALMISVSSFANEETPITSKEVKKVVRTKIVNLLGTLDFKLEEDVKATVDIMINKKGELIVLDVDSNSPKVINYLKRKLNYKKVYKNLKKEVRVYKLPIRVVSK